MPPLDRNGFPPVSPEDQLWLKYLQDQVPEGHDMFARYPSVPLQYLRGYMHAEFRDLPRKDAADMTVKLLKECVLWRNAFGIDAISDSDLPRCLAFAPMCPMGVSGSDSDGHPIWVFHPFCIELMRTFDPAESGKFVFQSGSEDLARARRKTEVAARRPMHLDTKIMDLYDGLTLTLKCARFLSESLSWTPPTPGAIKVNVLEKYNPCTLKKLYLINVPWMLRKMSALIFPLLHKTVQQKIVILGSDFLPRLTADGYPLTSLPAYFGGGCTGKDPHGIHYCSEIPPTRAAIGATRPAGAGQTGGGGGGAISFRDPGIGGAIARSRLSHGDMLCHAFWTRRGDGRDRPLSPRMLPEQRRSAGATTGIRVVGRFVASPSCGKEATAEEVLEVCNVVVGKDHGAYEGTFVAPADGVVVFTTSNPGGKPVTLRHRTMVALKRDEAAGRESKQAVQREQRQGGAGGGTAECAQARPVAIQACEVAGVPGDSRDSDDDSAAAAGGAEGAEGAVGAEKCSGGAQNDARKEATAGMVRLDVAAFLFSLLWLAATFSDKLELNVQVALLAVAVAANVGLWAQYCCSSSETDRLRPMEAWRIKSG